MAVGLRVRNSSHVLQIDGNYQNSELISSGTITLNLDDPNALGKYSTIGIPSGKTLPIIAFRCTTQGVYWKLADANTIKIFAGGTTAVNVQYFIFGEPTETSNIGGVGIVIRSQTTGKVVYNSNRKYLRILQPIVGTINPDEVVSGSFAGRKIAVVQCMRPNYTSVTPGGPVGQPIFVIQLKSGVARTPDDSSFILENRQVAAFTGFGVTPAEVQSNPYANYMVVDVTGY